MEKRVSIRDVAALTGFSVATVSQILNGKRLDRYSTETRRVVIESAEQIGYKPNSLARGLRMQQSGVIGMVSNQIVTTPYAGKIVLGAQRAAQECDHVLMVVNSEGDVATEEKVIRSLLQHQVDAILYASLVKQSVHVPAILDHTLTAVVHGHPDAKRHPVIQSDERAGAATAVRHLLDFGHRRIGFVTTTQDLVAADERLAGYEDALAEAGVTLDAGLILRSETSPAGARQSARLLLTRSDRPTAIFCFSDHMAMGVYQAANNLGLHVPGDLSVIGFGDLELISTGLLPALTTVAIPYFDMGRTAVQTLVDNVGQGAPIDPNTSRLLSCTLVPRSSVAAAGPA